MVDYIVGDANYIDHDLKYCMEFNEFPFTFGDVVRVHAIFEGERDGEAWRWVIELKDHSFYYVWGWCDFTGWDCQSGARVEKAESAAAACWCELMQPFVVEVWDYNVKVLDDLRLQVDNGRRQGWYEVMDEVMDVSR